MSKIKERENTLLELLQTYRKLSIQYISDYFAISEATARRLCSKLEQEKQVVRTHGGVQILDLGISDYSFQNKENTNLPQKVAIGNYCSSLINSNERIYCDSGTTIKQLIISLTNRLRNNELSDVTVLSNSLSNYDPIANYCKVILLGGEVRINRLDLCGPLTEDNIRKFGITKAFLGVDAINMKRGYMTTDERTARINEIILAEAETTYVLTDSSKFDKSSFISYAELGDITETITDWELDDALRMELEAAGVKIFQINPPKRVLKP